MDELARRAQELADRATSAPWTWTRGMDARCMVLGPNGLEIRLSGYADAEFIAESRSLVPALLDRLAAAQSRLEAVAVLHPKQLHYGSASSFGPPGDPHYRCGRCQPAFESGRWPCPTMVAVLLGTDTDTPKETEK